MKRSAPNTANPPALSSRSGWRSGPAPAASIALLALLVVLVACSPGRSAEDLQRDGLARLAAYDYAGAVLTLKNALTKQPDLAPARRALGEAYLAQGLGAPAQKEFERAQQLGETVDPELEVLIARAEYVQGNHAAAIARTAAILGQAPAAAAHTVRGLALLETGEDAAARGDFEAALALAPDHGEARYGLARAAFRAGDTARARAWLTAATERTPDDPETWLHLGEFEYFVGNAEAAESAFRRVLESPRAAPGTMLRATADGALARLLLGRSEVEAAQPFIQSFTRARPEHPLGTFLQAHSAYLRDDFDRADDLLRELLSRTPNHRNGLLLQALVRFQKDDVEQTQYYLAQYLAITPNADPQVRKLLASILVRRDDANGAIAVLLPVADLSDDPELLALLASAFLMEGKQAQASDWFERAAAVDGQENRQRSRRALGQLLGDEGDAGLEALKALARESSETIVADRYLVYAHVARGELEEALAAAQALKEKKPAEAGPDYLAGVVLRRMGKTDEAIAALERSLALDPDFHPAVLELAGLALAAGRPERAQVLYERTLATDAGNVAALMGMGYLALDRGQAERAIGYFERVRQIDRGALAARLNLADLYLSTRRGKEALDAAEEAFGLAPGNARAMQMLVRAQRVAGDPRRGREAIEQFLATNPEAAVDYLRTAQSLLELDDTEGAMNVLREHVASGDASVAGRIAMANVALEAGDPERARTLALEVAEAAPELAAPHALLYQAHVALRQYERAVGAARAIVERAPENLNSHFLLAAALQGAGRPDEARGVLEALLATRPDDRLVLMNLGRLAENAGQFAEAEARYRQVLKRLPGDDDAAAALARLLEQASGDAEAGASELEQARKADAGNLEVRILLARRHVRAGRVDEAREVLDEMLAINPNHPRALELAVGLALLQQDPAAARAMAERWVTVEPNRAMAHQQLAVTQIQSGDRAAAERHLRRAVELDPRDVAALYTLASLELEGGNAEASMALAERAMAQAPENVEAVILKGDALWRLGRRQEALDTYTQARDLAPGTRATLRLANARAAVDGPDAATSLLEAWLADHPDDRDARFALADLQLAAGDADAARAGYEALVEGGAASAPLLNRLAWLYHEAGDARAEATAQRAYDLEPANANVQDTLGWILVSTGKVEQGLTLLKKVADAGYAGIPPAEQPASRLRLAQAYATAGRKREAVRALEGLLADAPAFDGRKRAEALLEALSRGR